MAMTFIQVKKIISSSSSTKVEKEFIRADKIETFRRFIRNDNNHNDPFSTVSGEVTKIIMKTLSNPKNKDARGVYEVYINESEESFSSRLSANGVRVIL